jgi:hypothetical protein
MPQNLRLGRRARAYSLTIRALWHDRLPSARANFAAIGSEPMMPARMSSQASLPLAWKNDDFVDDGQFNAAAPGDSPRSIVEGVCRSCQWKPMCCLFAAALEELDGAFVLLRARARGEGSEISPLAGFRIHLARIKPVLAGPEFSYHAAHHLADDDRAATTGRRKNSSSKLCYGTKVPHRWPA